jgi:hypothetical protein
MRAFCKGNLGIPRRNMPQVEGEIRETYLFDKFQQGTVIQNIQIAAHQLTSVQSEISHKIVISMIKSYNLGTFSPCERSILTAYNGTHYKIMDGHHTAIACRLLGGNQDAIVVFEKNHEVLSELQHLSGSFRRALDDSISKP